jgi:mannose-6-phosphate isomerase-like protein (cupin superfamily)
LIEHIKKEMKMADANNPITSVFSLKTPKLSSGKLTNSVAQTDLMNVAVKVYASGGENAMHQHPHEDHAFIVLEGQATFYLGTDDNIKVCNKYDGVLVPKGASYWFKSSSPENLVLIRVGAATVRPENWRAFPDGKPFVGLDKENKNDPLVRVPGEFVAVA